jgi:cyclohexadieny/prephenate dehydrogenase|tara:strand:+ start:1493 stop:2407 length:915 start_codon:yes stop_codon:yes gene_type:complete
MRFAIFWGRTVTDTKVQRIALVGIGLIGSSIANAVRKENLAAHIAISTRSETTLARAEVLNLGDSYHAQATDAVKDADIVVISVPLSACEAVAKEISTALKPGAIVTDVSSCKASVIADMGPHIPDGVHFVPGHPIAGTEHSGPDAGFADLFKGRWCILTPPNGTDEKAVEQISELWKEMGSMVEVMEPEHHDQVLAITSHLPHLIAYSIVDTATNLQNDLKQEVIKFSASGFRDFTRIAASDPVMWRDVFMKNRDAVLDVLGQFSEDLAVLQRAIRRGEADKLEEVFTRTREIRRSVIDYKQD